MESSDRHSKFSHASTILCDPDMESQYDIIFVHGLSGDPVRSWTHKGTDSECVWPRDILPIDFPTSRIISLGYNSNLTGSGATSQSIFDHARGMLSDIRRFRDEVRGRPILFVAHGIGGNILKEMLITSFHEDVPEGENIARSTTAILFFATPQRGTETLNDLYTGMQIVRFLGLRTARRLVKQLRPGTDYLYETSIKFNEVLKAVQIQLVSFHATLPLRIGLLRKNSPSREDVLIGNPHEQCLSLEGAPDDIQRISGRQDPNYARVLGLLQPLMHTTLLARFPKVPGRSVQSEPNEKSSYADFERTEALERGLHRVVVTKWSTISERGNIDVPVAALIDESSDENIISYAFLADSFPPVLLSAGRMTLTFMPASGGGAQSRHFKTQDDISHPMILGAGGLYSRSRPTEATEETYSGTGSRSPPAEEEYQPAVVKNTDDQQVIRRGIPATSNKDAKPSLRVSGAAIKVSPPAAVSQEIPISPSHTIPRTTLSGILASSGNLARSLTEAAGSSPAWTPSTHIALGAAITSAASGGTAMYSASVAHGAKAQAIRSANIAERNLKLNEDVFQYQKTKDEEERKERAAAVAAAIKNASAVVSSSQSDSDSDVADSGVGRSSSKSTSSRFGAIKRSAPSISPTLSPNESSAPPDRLNLPAVPTHGLDAKPWPPKQKPIEPVDRESIEMDHLLNSKDAESAMGSVEISRPDPAYSHGSYPVQRPSLPSAEDPQARKDPGQPMTTKDDTSITADVLPFDQKHGRHSQLETRAGPVGAVDNIKGSDDHSSLQQDSTSSPDERDEVQEVESGLLPQNEPLGQKFEDQLSCIASPAITEEPVQGSESIFDNAVHAEVEEQNGAGTEAHQDPQNKMVEETPSSTKPEPAESGTDEMPISISAKDAADGTAKAEHDYEPKDSMIVETQNMITDSQEGEVKEQKVEDGQIEDAGAEADHEYEEEPKIKDESEDFSPGLHDARGPACTSQWRMQAKTDGIL